MTTIPHPIDRSPAAALAYLAAGHSNGEAAARFGVNERTVRKWKAQAREAQPEEPPAPVPSSRPVRRVPCPPRPRPSAPIRARFPATHDDVAGDTTSWRCPATGELLPIIPGTRRKTWEAERIAAHLRHQAAVVWEALEAAPAPPAPDRPVEPVASQSAGPAPAPAVDPAPEPGPAPRPPAPVIVVRRYGPSAEREGVLTWVWGHEYRAFILGAVLAVGLIMACW